MSTTTALAPDKTTDDTYVAHSPSAALLATVIALALFDLFANGLWPTCLHLAVGLAVFGAVRLCVGLALEPFIPTDAPESNT
ncbi:hypothetical protein [Streptomyces prasinus]